MYISPDRTAGRPQLGRKGDVRRRGVLEIVFKTPEMDIPPWYWFRVAVPGTVGNSLAGLASRKEEVKRRCRTVLQSRAEGLPRNTQPDSQRPAIVHPTLALV